MNRKILVLSDSHGYTNSLETVLLMHKDADFVFFLGDGYGDIESCGLINNAVIYSVRGNRDFGINTDEEALIDVGGYRFLLCHGHRHMVKQTNKIYIMYAKQKGADVALFGHTHQQVNEYLGEDKPMYLFNPGSISVPDRGEPSYGLITVTDKGLFLTHGTV